MIFSRFDPENGEYDYFESPGALAAINDDLGAPGLPPPVSSQLGREIGLPSTECGRAMPSGATHVGRGELAEGHITPPAHVKLSGYSSTGDGQFGYRDVVAFLAGAAVIGIVWLISERK